MGGGLNLETLLYALLPWREVCQHLDILVTQISHFFVTMLSVHPIVSVTPRPGVDQAWDVGIDNGIVDIVFALTMSLVTHGQIMPCI